MFRQIAPIALLLCTTAVIPPALAQERAPEVLPGVVVSAARDPLPAEQVGASAQVITRAELEERQVRTVDEALRFATGVSVNRSGMRGNLTQVRIRGGEANQTLVLIDGIEVTNPAAFGGPEFDFAHLMAADVERIEVLRGPQSALYGADAVSGVINIITRRATEEGWTGSALVEGGSFGTTNVALSAGWRGRSADLQINSTKFSTSNDSIVRADGADDDGYQHTGLSLSGGVRPSDNSEIRATMRYSTADQHTDFVPFDTDAGSENERFAGRVEGRLSLFDGAWEQRVGGSFNTEETVFFSPFGPFETQGQRLKADYQSTLRFDTPALANAHHALTLAAEYEEEDAISNPGAPIENIGLVAEYRVDLFDRLFLTGAVRHDINDPFEDATTVRATAAYLVKETGTRLHASFGQGIKNPTFDELFTNFPPRFGGPGFIANPNLEPEESEGFDIGVEQSLWDGRITFDVTYFQNRTDNFIQSVPSATAGFNTAANVPGATDAEGWEVSLEARPIDDLIVTGSYAYVHTEAPGGLRLQRRPMHTGSLAATWFFDVMDRPGNLTATATYTGEQTDTDFSAFPFSTVELDSYTLVNLAGEVEVFPGWSLTGRVENLTDEDYQEVFGFNATGIGAYVGVRAQF